MIETRSEMIAMFNDPCSLKGERSASANARARFAEEWIDQRGFMHVIPLHVAFQLTLLRAADALLPQALDVAVPLSRTLLEMLLSGVIGRTNS
jgi:hypothetical protein